MKNNRNSCVFSSVQREGDKLSTELIEKHILKQQFLSFIVKHARVIISILLPF